MLSHYDIASQDLVLHIDSDIQLYDGYINDCEYCFQNFLDCKLFISYGKENINDETIDNCHQFNKKLLQNKDNYQYMPMGLGICRLCLVHESI
jgi:hypothetical protein